MITHIEKALVVDDDVLMREFIVETLRRKGISVTEAGDGIEAKRILETKDFDIAFIDLKMPGMDGMELLRSMKENKIETITIMVTAFGTVEQAVEAMKIGAYDFLMKPFSPEQVEMILKRTVELTNLQAQNFYLQEELGWKLPGGGHIIGQSPQMLEMMETIKRVAQSNSTVMIAGESGTGKELVALAIHSLSERRNMPFIRMNCAAVPDNLMDSELFGHEKGAFTSAISKRMGRFELAHGGTLLLDEISEMKIELQAKLLRVLQDQEFERVGGSRSIRTNCRIIATTNRDFQEHISSGNFRQDLFFRLNVLPINIPPLRERMEDIPILAEAFLKHFSTNRKDSQADLQFSEEATDAMCAYSWPGNVRELENLVERMCVMQNGPILGVDTLPAEIIDNKSIPMSTSSSKPSSFNLADIEQDTIMAAMANTGGNRQKTADILGISVRTLRNKLNIYKDSNELILQNKSIAA